MAASEGEDRQCFTICVFQDPNWATRGLAALQAQGFDGEAVSVLAKRTTEVDELIAGTFGVEPTLVDVKGLGATVGVGPLVGRGLGSEGGSPEGESGAP